MSDHQAEATRKGQLMGECSRRSRLAVRIVGWIIAMAALTLEGCAGKGVQHEVGPAPAVMPPVLALYNEGTAAFQAGALQKARERYQAALEQGHLLRDTLGISASLMALGATYQAMQDYPQALAFFSEALPHLIAIKYLPAEALALGTIGEVLVQMGNDPKAIEFFHRALGVAEQLLGNASDQDKLAILSVRANVFTQKAGAHERLGQWTEAIESARRAAADYRMVGNREMAGRILRGAADACMKIMAYQQAIELYTEAASLLQEVGKLAEAIRARIGLGWCYTKVGKFQEAIAVFSEVVEVAEHEGLSESVIDGYIGQATTFEGLTDFQQALTQYEAALQQLQKGKWKDRAVPKPALSPLSPDDVYASVREPGLLLLSKGKIYRVLSQYEEAIASLRAAAVRYREIGDANGEGNALTDLAEILSWIAEPQTAIQYYKRALDRYEVSGNLLKQVMVLAALGEANWLSEEGSFEENLGYFQGALELLASFRKTASVDPVAVQGEWWMNRKFPLELPKNLLQEVQKSIGSLPPEYIKANITLYLMMEQAKQFAEEWQRRSPSLGREYFMAAGNLLQKFGRVHLAGGDLINAIKMLMVATSAHISAPFNREQAFEWAKDWYFLAEAYRQQKNFDEALQFFRLAEVMATLLRSPERHFAYAGLARTYADLGDMDNAVNYYKLGFEMLESVRALQGTEEIKVGVLEGTLYVYRGFVTLLLDLYRKTGEERYLHDAFEYNERMRAQAFLEMLSRSRAARLEGATGQLTAKEEELRRQGSQLYHQITSLKQGNAEETRLLDQFVHLQERLRTLDREAARQSPQYMPQLFPHSVTIGAVQSILDADTVLLEYSTGAERSTLWAITKEQAHVYSLPSQEGVTLLEQYLKTLREPLMGADEVTRHVTLGQQLYRVLVEPAAEHTRGKKHLIIAPDGPLYYLPFEALLMPESQWDGAKLTTLANARYLVQQFQVSYVPSAAILVTERKERGSQRQTAMLPLVAFGDPVYPERVSSDGPEVSKGRVTNSALRSVRLNRLKFSGDEVRRIARIWGIPEHSVHINVGDRATVKHMREVDLSQYRMLHFAAHAVLGDEVRWANQPAIVLSEAGSEGSHPGLLQFADILDLKLHAELVVLSACNTGLGRLRGGEGIVGLTRAFLYAGASSVVVSLWNVEDQSTSLLMERFYQRLKQGESKAEALRQAKLEVLRTNIELKAVGTRQSLASPFYWAPFILVGAWD